MESKAVFCFSWLICYHRIASLISVALFAQHFGEGKGEIIFKTFSTAVGMCFSNQDGCFPIELYQPWILCGGDCSLERGMPHL